MMKSSVHSAYDEALAAIEKTKPHLSGFFHNAAAELSRVGRLGVSELRALGQLTSASEYLFIDVEYYVRLSIQKREFHLFCETMFLLARRGYRFAHVFLLRYATVEIPLTRIARPMVELADRCGGRIVRGERVLEFCLRFHEQEKILFFLTEFARIALASPGSVFDLLRNFAQHVEAANWGVVRAWIARGVEYLGHGRIEEGIAFFRGKTAESRRLLGLHHCVVGELKEVLKIYATSMTGHEVTVAPLNDSDFGYTEPYTDGTTLFVPAEFGLFADYRNNQRSYSVVIAHLAGFHMLATFALDLAGTPVMEDLRERYGTKLPPIRDTLWRQFRGKGERVANRADGEIEVIFPKKQKLLVLNTEHERFFYGFPLPALAKELFTLIESRRVEYRLVDRYPGLGEDYRLLKRTLWSVREESTRNGSLEQISIDDRKTLQVLNAVVRYLYLGTIEMRSPVIDGAIRILKEIESPTTTVEDTASCSLRLYRLLDEQFNLVRFSLYHDFSAAMNGARLAEIHSETVLNSNPALLKSEPNRPPLDIEEPTETAIDLASLGERARDQVGLSVASDALRIFRYPEFNTYQGVYQYNFCTVFERHLESKSSTDYLQLVREFRRVSERLKKRFLFLKPEELEVSRRWIAGDDVFLTDAVDFAIDLQRGASPDEKIYQKKITNNRDIVCAMLVDASSSTDEQVAGISLGTGSARSRRSPTSGVYEPSQGRIIDVEKAALSLAAAAMDHIGDTFGIFTFQSLGRDRVFFNVVKDFDDRWDSAAQARIGAIEAFASNRDGCAIRHAVWKLSQRSEKTKLLVLLSDGIPADIDYGGATSSDTSLYAIEDTRRALLEARRLGVIPFCITIDRFARDYVPRLYGDRQYVILPEVTRLPEKLSQLYLRLTR